MLNEIRSTGVLARVLQHPNFEVRPYSGPGLRTRLKYPIFSAESLDQCGFASTSESATTQHWAPRKIKADEPEADEPEAVIKRSEFLDVSGECWVFTYHFLPCFTYMPQGAWISWNGPPHIPVPLPGRQYPPASGASSL